MIYESGDLAISGGHGNAQEEYATRKRSLSRPNFTTHGVQNMTDQGRQRRGDGGCIPQHLGRGDAMPLIPLAATNLCQSSQCHIQLSVDCHSIPV